MVSMGELTPFPSAESPAAPAYLPAEPASPVAQRIDFVVVSPVVTEYVGGLPVGERVLQPTKLFLAAHPKLREVLSEIFKS